MSILDIVSIAISMIAIFINIFIIIDNIDEFL